MSGREEALHVEIKAVNKSAFLNYYLLNMANKKMKMALVGSDIRCYLSYSMIVIFNDNYDEAIRLFNATSALISSGKKV